MARSRQKARKSEEAISGSLVARCRAELGPGFELFVEGAAVTVRRNHDLVAKISNHGCAVWSRDDDHPMLLVGEFLGDGECWDRAKRHIQRSRVGRGRRAGEHPVEEWRRVQLATPDAASAQLVRDPPANATPRQLAEMIVDSQRLRTERVRAFGLSVELTLRHDQLQVEVIRLHPIRQNGQAPELPFSYEFGKRSLSGALRLASRREPMPLALYGPATEWVAHLRPWHLALVAGADLHCDPREGNRPGDFALVGESDDPSWTPPETWVPEESTFEWSARHVPGHFRRLPTGAASDDSRRHARALGLELPVRGLTWVRPHLNGLPPNTVLSFTWKPRLARG